MCISKILKNESNSQPFFLFALLSSGCCVSQRYWKMKAIHNHFSCLVYRNFVVVYPKDTEKWKQFTTINSILSFFDKLLCIPKILKNESNSQHFRHEVLNRICCCVSQRYWKMKAIHNVLLKAVTDKLVVVYPKDTEKWKQFTTQRLRGY